MTEFKTGKRLAKYVPDYVVFDLETTGTSYLKDSIIELSAVKVSGAKVVDTFSRLVNPQCHIPHQATQVNGITDEMVAGAPLLEQALPEFLDFIGSHVLVGHNIQSFDLKFIRLAAQELFGKEIPNDYIDTLYMARQCLPQLAHHKLTDLASYFQIDTQGAHRALCDCMMNQKCYEKMAKLQKEAHIEACPVCGGELVKRNGRFGAFLGCSNFPQCRFTKNA
ncbi:MAG: topoisomerase DNA-binding C4 zinc finger domain-containing protein [Eubacterium sp.]|nr:topoisomerase DNA-binding C4 zinc finger domain-containing protein [Eubacterium sp.]